mmetsp:Transcript_33922/g.80530  ORF Transcript_33922/g.80530 Transcript_33922/m.80530 type:complete len:81 (-) Transcript_33922:99-341(-)
MPRQRPSSAGIQLSPSQVPETRPEQGCCRPNPPVGTGEVVRALDIRPSFLAGIILLLFVLQLSAMFLLCVPKTFPPCLLD